MKTFTPEEITQQVKIMRDLARDPYLEFGGTTLRELLDIIAHLQAENKALRNAVTDLTSIECVGKTAAGVPYMRDNEFSRVAIFKARAALEGKE